MSRSRKARVTKLNPDLTGPGLDLMDFDSSVLYDDYLVGGTQVQVRGAAAPGFAEFKDGMYLYAFDGATTAEEVFFTIHMLHDISPKEAPTFHVHWSHNNASPSGNVKWNLEYMYAHGYEAGVFPTPVALSTVQAAGAQYAHHITPDDDMPFNATYEPDGQILVRLYRDPTDVEDTFASDAFLIGIDMHYRKGQVGTYERNRPFLSAGFPE